MLKAIIFDIDNTLYDYDAAHARAFGALTAYAREALALAPERFAALHRQAQAELERRCGGNCAALHNRLLRYQALLEGLGQPVVHAPQMSRIYWTAFLDAMRPFPGAAQTLERLKRLGLAVGVGTNMTAGIQFEKLIRLGFMPFVDFVVTSEEVTAEKPDRRLFDACVQKAGCAAGQCAFVGDSLEKDVQGAMRAGLRGVWLRREGEPERAIPGATVIRALPELIGLVSEER